MPGAPSDLLIGVGNTLRRDDGAGHQIAERAAAVVPGVECLLAHQLDITMVEKCAGRRRLVIADVSVEDLEEEVWLRRIVPTPWSFSHAHALSPQTLLSLINSIHGRAPEAWLATVLGHEFGLGETLSPRCSRAVAQMVPRVGALLGSTR